MTHKQKKEKGIIIIPSENIISNSVIFNVDDNPRLMRFAVKDFYTTFKQESIVRFQKAGNEYEVLVLRIDHRVDTCFIRGLIKSDKTLA